MPPSDKEERAVGKHVQIVRVETLKTIASQNGSIRQQTFKTIAV